MFYFQILWFFLLQSQVFYRTPIMISHFSYFTFQPKNLLHLVILHNTSLLIFSIWLIIVITLFFNSLQVTFICLNVFIIADWKCLVNLSFRHPQRQFLLPTFFFLWMGHSFCFFVCLVIYLNKFSGVCLPHMVWPLMPLFILFLFLLLFVEPGFTGVALV